MDTARARMPYLCVAPYVAAAFALTLTVRLVTYVMLGLAPFGGSTIASMDANIQYLDLFCYYKDVLEGQAGLAYSFSKGPGGNMVAVFAYYLASPLNFLVVLFDKTQMPTFMDVVFALKCALSAACMCVFLACRFGLRQKRGELVWPMAVLLGVCYGLSHYCSFQSSNIMWLDGVYFLPLYLLFIYRIVRGGRGVVGLAVVVGLSILANWYTAGINCVFSFFWFAVEALIAWSEGEGVPARELALRVMRFLLALLCGLLLSCALFVPTVSVLRKSTRGALDMSQLADLGLVGNPLSIVSGYTYGMASTGERTVAYAGFLPLVGCAGVFASGMKRRRKVVLAGVLVLAVVITYWHPLWLTFSLLSTVESYHCRYAYLVEAMLVFVAAFYLLGQDLSEKKQALPLATVVVALAIVATCLVNGEQTPSKAVLTAAVAVGGCALLVWSRQSWGRGESRAMRAASMAVLAGLCLMDLGYDACLTSKMYAATIVDSFATYTEQTLEQVAELRARDASTYRLRETTNRGNFHITQPGEKGGDPLTLSGSFDLIEDYGIPMVNLSAQCNEPLTYGYLSTTKYTSSPDGSQMHLLDSFGFSEVTNLCVVETPIIAADSLLGVKYLLSEYPIEGLRRAEGTGTYNGKDAYENPYCLPLAFTVPSSAVGKGLVNSANPFENLDSLYTSLLGHEAGLYVPLDCEVTSQGDVDEGTPLVVEVTMPEGDYVCYGNIPTRSTTESLLNVNGAYQTWYDRWLAPRVFYIPSDGTGSAIMTMTSNTSYDLDTSAMQFYALDLGAMRSASDELSARAADLNVFEDGHVEATVREGHEGEALLLSVSSDMGWTVERNGSVVETGTVGTACMPCRLWTVRTRYA